MIPKHLYISGFLSYCQPVEIDFTTFDLACISGHNGAGKSSLLDAITWALFGQARKRDDSIINLQSKAAEVRLTFEYEGNLYRVQRTWPRGKSAMLEFQVADFSNGSPQWRPLSERSARETQARIEETLRLDYDTFVNAAFFLQGKADQFTQQPPGKRKEILSNILGLEIWETYKERTAERRKELERQVSELEGRIAEIDAELDEEHQRKARLRDLEEQLKERSAARARQESLLDQMKQIAAAQAEQIKAAQSLRLSLEQAQTALARLESRRAEQEANLATQANLVQHADEIRAAYQAWQQARLELEKWEQKAAEFRQYDEKRQPLLRQIESEKARLEQERQSLRAQEEKIQKLMAQRPELSQKIEEAQKALEEAEEQVNQARQLEQQIHAAQQRQAALKAENESLKAQMKGIKTLLDRVEQAEEAECPLCGQALSPEHRQQTLENLQQEGKTYGDRYRANQDEISDLSVQIQEMENQLRALIPAEARRLALSNTLSQWQERQQAVEEQIQQWEKDGAPRLREISETLSQETFAPAARQQLQQIDTELSRVGYDITAHEAARRAEVEGRSAEEQYRQMESAHLLLRQIEAELAALNTEIAQRQAEIQEAETRYNALTATLKENILPDMASAEAELLQLRAEENQTREAVSQARQAVEVLNTLRTRKAEYTAQGEELRRAIARHKTLERAFGKDGVPALLIEQALPQIEAKANEILERLTDGQMSVRFVTQAEYKDKKREDLKETLDIQISDGAGTRDYEMYSGGEAFRVNFAIRLALSEILAQRKGARLQTLVIDEGFGTQDAQGRQRLVEAINLVKDDFAKILVITHLDELKDAFPTRIEVEKTADGSRVKVV